MMKAMKNSFEFNNEERDISSVISRIKKAEESSRDVSERDEEVVERLKIKIAEINEITKGCDAVDIVNPSGRMEEGRRLSYKEEIEKFKKEISKNPEYNPVFTYPKIEKLNVDDLKERIKSLEALKDEVGAEENEHLKNIVNECAGTALAEMNFILAVKNEDDEKAYQYSVEAFGDIDQKLVDENEEYYKNKLKNNLVFDNPLRKKLREIKLSSEDLKDMFQVALDVLESKDFDINVIRDEENISISDTRKEIKIPDDKRYSGERVVELVSHEICTHAISMMNSKNVGFEGISAGKDVTTFKEGIAMYSEEKTGEHIFGDHKPNDKDWYIHAMEYRKEGNGFGKTFLELKKRILEQYLAQGVEQKKAEKNAEKDSLTICRRIFRGMHDLSANKNYYFTKDACYFRGYMESQKMMDEGLDHYLTDLRVDPYLLPYFLSLKALPEKALHANREVIEAMWDKKGFSRDFLENYDWYKENTQMDRHMAYRREFGQINEEVLGARKKIVEDLENKVNY